MKRPISIALSTLAFLFIISSPNGNAANIASARTTSHAVANDPVLMDYAPSAIPSKKGSLSPATVDASFLPGKWLLVESDTQKSDDKEKDLDVEMRVTDTLTLAENGHFVERSSIMMNFRVNGEDNVIQIESGSEGEWSCAADSLTMTTDKKSIFSKITKTDLPKALVSPFVKSFIKEAKEAAKKPSVYKIEQLTTKKLKMAQIEPESSSLDTYNKLK